MQAMDLVGPDQEEETGHFHPKPETPMSGLPDKNSNAGKVMHALSELGGMGSVKEIVKKSKLFDSKVYMGAQDLRRRGLLVGSGGNNNRIYVLKSNGA